MKTRFATIILLCLSFLAFSQENNEGESYFIALYTLGENWDMKKSPNEQLHFKAHSSFLSQLRKDSTIVIGARYSDTGMLLLKAKNLEAAKTLLHKDIAIQNKLFNLEIYPYAPFYKGCIE